MRIGTTEVATYISSRVAVTNASESALFARDHPVLGQSRWNSSPKWQSETVALNCFGDLCKVEEPDDDGDDGDDGNTGGTGGGGGGGTGAISGVTYVGAIIAASASLLAF